MTPIFDAEIIGPSAWTPRALGGKEGLVHALGAEELSAIDDLLKRLEGKPTLKITRADFEHPALTPFLDDVKRDLMVGRGAPIVRGVTVARHGRENCERILWGMGTHMGVAAVQSTRADRIGYVREEPGETRGYRGSGELTLHTDSRPVIVLMSLENAAEGGESYVASSMTIHNVIRRERPDLLAALYRGYFYHSVEIEMTPKPIPVFSNVDGVVSCMFFQGHMRRAAKTLGVELPADLDEALRFFAAVGERDDVCARFMLEPGEIIFCNNFSVLHARTEFRNSAEKTRLLARLWLNTPGGRPVVPELLERSRRFDINYDPDYREAAPA